MLYSQNVQVGVNFISEGSNNDKLQSEQIKLMRNANVNYECNYFKS